MLVSIRPSVNLSSQIESRIFFDQLLSYLKQAQQSSVLQNKVISIDFLSGNQVIVIKDLSMRLDSIHLDIPNHIQLLNTFGFRYYPSGSISDFKTVVFYDLENESKINLAFQLGNGQFELQK